MPDWTRSMSQTFDFYIVDPLTWGNVRKLENIRSCKITRDLETDTIYSASFDCYDEELCDVYVRVYLVVEQDGVRERIPLGTFLAQTPNISFDGAARNGTVDAYSPLTELKEKMPPIGYALRQGDDILAQASAIVKENIRPPVVSAKGGKNLQVDFVSEADETWLSFLTDLLAQANYSFDIDEMGRTLMVPKQNVNEMRPIFTYTDDNSSILYPELTVERDLYGVPNVVEVVYSPSDGMPMFSRVVNDDSSSITSIKSRGREIIYRETNPDVAAGITQEQLDEYAKNLLKQMSTLEYKMTYRHGYCPVRLGDCVLFNYERSGITGVKGRVQSQTIDCTPGAAVEETAVYTKELWG